MDRLAAASEDIQRHASRLKKVSILAEYFKTLDAKERALAVQLLSSGPLGRGNPTLFETGEKLELKIGRSVLREALRAATGWDKETLSVCHAQVGDTGETVGLMMRGISAGEPLGILAADDLYQGLFRARTTARRVELLAAIFRKYQPLTLKYFVKMMTRGLRIGLMARQVQEALAAAGGEAAKVEARLFQPLDLMLAKPLERVEDLADPAEWLIEDKYDGMRAQVHFDHEAGVVRIFSRNMEEITQAFPELMHEFGQLPGNGLLDGEILAWRDGRALNFNVLQRRLSVRRARATLVAEVPVIFMAYDLLLRNGKMLLGEPLSRRREKLEELRSSMISRQYRVGSHAQVDRLFAEARARGNEGLLLKKPDSVYEPGRRGGAWLKLKRPYGTLDVVITAAEQGSGRRATVFSDYTFAVRAAQGFVNVGKAYSGLTDEEIKDLTRQLRAASVEKFGRMMLVKPEIVLEVAFDGVQRSTRHKGGYALRFPRILRWRKDKKPEECDDLGRVEALYQASVE
jgi:DNA ligase-1